MEKNKKYDYIFIEDFYIELKIDFTKKKDFILNIKDKDFKLMIENKHIKENLVLK